MAQSNSDWAAQAGLVYDTVVDMGQLAEESYTAARASLDTLVEQRQDLNTTLIDTDIGTDVDRNWTNTEIEPGNLPEEPDYSGFLPSEPANVLDPTEPTDPTIAAPTKPDAPAITEPTKPSQVSVNEKPGDITLGDTPEDIADAEFGEIPELVDVPEITAVVPTISVDTLTADFSFTEPTYTERVSVEVEAGIKQVLGGDMGLPQGYWDSVWQEHAGDIARVQVGKLRNARNRGAATYWGMPTETVLAGSRAISDETTRSLQQTRMEQTRAQIVYAREDFWKAIAQGIAYEQQWIDAHQQMAARALAAAEQAVNLSIAVYNANVQQYNFLLQAARLEGEIVDMKVKRALAIQQAALQARGLEIQQDAANVQRFQARWQGYDISSKAQISHLAEQIRYWASTAEADTGYTQLGLQARTEQERMRMQNDQANENLQLQRNMDYAKTLMQKELSYEGLKFQKTGLDLQKYSALLQRIQAISGATASVLAARTGVFNANLAGQQAVLDRRSLINSLEVEVAKLTQAAQESKANLDISQTQWLEGQANQLASSIADLAYGYAQAAVTAARVSLGSSVSNGFAETWSKQI